MTIVNLSDRSVIRISGENISDFLQGLVSNDVRDISDDRAVFAALLTPQGKFMFDFFMVKDGNDILLETEKKLSDELIKRLKMYRLRAKIDISALPIYCYQAIDGDVQDGKISYQDPRDDRLGIRILSKEAIGEARDNSEYEKLRIGLGIPEGSKDATERTILLENGYDKLNGVSFTKGCYVGQEVTARSYHRGELKKYIFKVEGEGDLPDAGTEIKTGDSTIGEMRSSIGQSGLALIRTDCLQKALDNGSVPEAGNIKLKIIAPFWHDIVI